MRRVKWIYQFPGVIINCWKRVLGKNYSDKNTPWRMSHFVIGVSGVTCSGKTTLTKLLQKSLPWARVVHQDSYFLDDDNPAHQRVPTLDNHVNYEIPSALDMPKMVKDLEKLLEEKSQGQGPIEMAPEDSPNFDDTAAQLYRSVVDSLDSLDTAKYSHIPILIIEGFLIYENEWIVGKGDAKFFLTLDQATCRGRRMSRVYNPPDIPGYFDAIVWPEYMQHFAKYVEPRARPGGGIKVFDGDEDIKAIWKNCMEIIMCRLNEKYFSSHPH